ncbi:hypothetical protein A9404_00790 [Halothiobacillus diazotrophicus]|uniref:Cytochrome c domain-containing protein n=1 Tax=Halothiobacillus diazotrophicus TaxID=1860122 RepID=A0A191ZE12_9GAMM|nr:urate hydroxylase PuuD [Halothiobacillus diazotrophicus]ANJ66108.1 hypothetical protein A9404_00790 [Halothiobacillus diazotrophicus]
MTAYLHAWLSLGVMWLHVIAGVAWIGASFYFIWLDNHLREPPEWKQALGIKGDLWAIHGGGFYEVAKYRLGPPQMPTELHWFKWEAYTTWLSGMALLTLVYYLGSTGYLIDPAKVVLAPWTAAAIGLGSIAAGLAIYETLLRSPLARHGALFGIVLYLVLVAFAWGLFQVFSGRGAFIHVGAIIGTIMVGNVFLGIMPAQRLLVRTVERGATPGPEVARRAAEAKLRSTHNNYLTLPIILIMISNHTPLLYSRPDGWLILAALGFITALARHYFNLRHRNINRPVYLIAPGLLTLALIGVLLPQVPSESGATGQGAAARDIASDAQIRQIVATRCLSCHSAHPGNPQFQAPPAGLAFDTLAELRLHRDAVLQATVQTHYMPLGNVTQMTEAERAALGEWLRQQTPK